MSLLIRRNIPREDICDDIFLFKERHNNPSHALKWGSPSLSGVQFM